MKEIANLNDVVKILRGPDGCPWDKEQTFESLTPHIIEEAYELVDAIEKKDYSELKEELGDVLLHIVMIASMAEEKAIFDLNDVAKDVSDKMIRRHPHVFSDKKVNTVEEVWKNWDAIKQNEKKDTSLLDSIPKKLPSLLRASKIQKRVSKTGFKWAPPTGAVATLNTELEKLKKKTGAKDKLLEEAGHMLFSVVSVLRQHNINPEEALQKANQTVISEFNKAAH